MDACAKELQSFSECELDIVCFNKSNDAPFEHSKFFQYPCKVFAPNDLETFFPVKRFDLVLICGFHIPEYRRAARRLFGKSIRVLCFDMQWNASPRQWLAVMAFRIYLRHFFDYAFVPGVRQARYANKMGFPIERIVTGSYSCDLQKFWAFPKRAFDSKIFLYVGRVVNEKGVDILAQAWKSFSSEAKNSDWRLQVCGTGPLSHLLDSLPQVEMLGFVQPAELPEIMSHACALVLPSRKEPWGLVIHEAAAAGLPLILSERCGAFDYYLRPGLNGYCVDLDDVNALYQAFEKFVQLTRSQRAHMGIKSEKLAGQCSPSTWVASVTRCLI